jgi:excisionase family DNA binding protein
VGGHPEKLLTLEEAVRWLGLPAEGIEELILQGKLPSFRLAGNLLRFRLRDVETLRLDLQKRRLRRPSPLERIYDFFYFNNFYLIAFLILLTLVAIIFTL